MTQTPNGLESALDGLLTGLDELLAHRPGASPSRLPLPTGPTAPLQPTAPLVPLVPLAPPASVDAAFHLLTALLHQAGLSGGLREATLGQIRRMVTARAQSHPEGLAWRGPAQVSPRLIPWLRSLLGQRGLQLWVSEEGEWLHVAQWCSAIQDPSARSDPARWSADLCGDFPVCQLAQVLPFEPLAGEENDAYCVLRLPRLPEFCRLRPQGSVLIPDPLGEPAMARWLDRPIPAMPGLLGVAWPLSQTLNQDLRLPIPVVGIAAHLG